MLARHHINANFIATKATNLLNDFLQFGRGKRPACLESSARIFALSTDDQIAFDGRTATDCQHLVRDVTFDNGAGRNHQFSADGRA